MTRSLLTYGFEGHIARLNVHIKLSRYTFNPVFERCWGYKGRVIEKPNNNRHDSGGSFAIK